MRIKNILLFYVCISLIFIPVFAWDLPTINSINVIDSIGKILQFSYNTVMVIVNATGQVNSLSMNYTVPNGTQYNTSNLTSANNGLWFSNLTNPWSCSGATEICSVDQFGIWKLNITACNKENTTIPVGNPSSNINLMSMVTFNNMLFVGTAGGAEGAKIYRYLENGTWVYSGSLEAYSSSGVQSLIIFNNSLYAGADDGHVYRYSNNGSLDWIDVGQLGTSTVYDMSLMTFTTGDNGLYGGTKICPSYPCSDDQYIGKVYKYSANGSLDWITDGTLSVGVSSLSESSGVRWVAAMNGHVYGNPYVFGSGGWVDKGQLGTESSLRGFTMGDSLYVGGKSGTVYKLSYPLDFDSATWNNSVGITCTNCGSSYLGVSSLIYYNSELFAGVSATGVTPFYGKLYKYQSGTNWKELSNSFEAGASVIYTMGIFNNSLYAGLSSGTATNRIYLINTSAQQHCQSMQSNFAIIHNETILTNSTPVNIGDKITLRLNYTHGYNFTPLSTANTNVTIFDTTSSKAILSTGNIMTYLPSIGLWQFNYTIPTGANGTYKYNIKANVTSNTYGSYVDLNGTFDTIDISPPVITSTSLSTKCLNDATKKYVGDPITVSITATDNWAVNWSASYCSLYRPDNVNMTMSVDTVSHSCTFATVGATIGTLNSTVYVFDNANNSALKTDLLTLVATCPAEAGSGTGGGGGGGGGGPAPSQLDILALLKNVTCTNPIECIKDSDCCNTWACAVNATTATGTCYKPVPIAPAIRAGLAMYCEKDAECVSGMVCRNRECAFVPASQSFGLIVVVMLSAILLTIVVKNGPKKR